MVYTGQKYATQYYSSVVQEPNSFLIAGISKYHENCKNVSIDDLLCVKHDIDNEYDNNAHSICKNNMVIGYVPKSSKFYQCENKCEYKLKVLNKKYHKGSFGIRVVPINVVTV